MMNTTIYGIPNCDSCKKALKWLTENGIAHQFVDFKKTPPSEALLDSWLERVAADKLVNKRSTTWKQLSDTEKATVQQSPSQLMMAYPTLVKRPVLVVDNRIHLGFKADEYSSIFSD